MCKLAAGDMVAIEAEYHLSCLSRLYRQSEAARNEVQGQRFEELMKKEYGI